MSKMKELVQNTVNELNIVKAELMKMQLEREDFHRLEEEMTKMKKKMSWMHLHGGCPRVSLLDTQVQALHHEGEQVDTTTRVHSLEERMTALEQRALAARLGRRPHSKERKKPLVR
ncbi:hypothetical protein L1887_11773 [Cichorium endivia]|nr:hypothetical protein L1887_11773 [Cichorium endivia]